MNSDSPPTGVSAAGIERQRPFCWEALYAAALIDERLRPLRSLYRNVVGSPQIQHTTTVSWPDGVEAIQEFCRIATDSSSRLGPKAEELAASFGAIGRPGDPQAIARAVKELVGLCGKLCKADLQLARLRMPGDLAPTQRGLTGITECYADELARLADQLRGAPAAAARGETVYHLRLEVSAERFKHVPLPQPPPTPTPPLEFGGLNAPTPASRPKPNEGCGCLGCLGWAFVLWILCSTLRGCW